MRVLVTGSSGFIGNHLVVALAARGDRVLGLDLREPRAPVTGVSHVGCDVCDLKTLSGHFHAFRPDAVLHLAGRTDLDESRDLNGYAANIVGVENVLAATRSTPSVRRAICTSSQLVCRVGYVPAHDEDYQPSTLYGQSKVKTETIWRAADGAGTEWCIVRPTTIWGPGMNPHYLRFFQMIRNGTYWNVGGGATFKSYGYVGNTVVQYIRLLDAPSAAIARRVFFLADYDPIVLEAWAEAFRIALGAPAIRSMPLGVARAAARIGDVVNWLGAKRFPFNSFRLNNVLTPYRADLCSTRAVCGELPYSMRDGVNATTRWLRDVWAAQDPNSSLGPSELPL